MILYSHFSGIRVAPDSICPIRSLIGQPPLLEHCPSLGSLFVPSAHSAYFILTRQAEAEECAGGLRWTEEANIGQDDISRADINAAARYGGTRPHGRQLNLPQPLTGRGVQRHQPVAHESGEIDYVVGDGDTGCHRVTDVLIHRPGRWTANGCHL